MAETLHTRCPYYVPDLLDVDPDKDTLYRLGPVSAARASGKDLVLSVKLVEMKPRDDGGECEPEIGRIVDKKKGPTANVRIRLYGRDVIRMKIGPSRTTFDDKSPMLDFDKEMKPLKPKVKKQKDGWMVWDDKYERLFIPKDEFAPRMIVDGEVKLDFQADDHFFASFFDALPAVMIERKETKSKAAGVAFAIEPNEHFCGTGERFDRLDLFGRRIDLVNTDALGVNNRRAYKNVPFIVSSRPYGLFVHSSAKMTFDVGRQSTRSLQVVAEDDALDLFFVGGGDIGSILENYCRITGFPAEVPDWSYGIWMSKMTYLSDEEVTGIAKRLREEEFPCDVLHLDTGWFREDWKCEWTFSEERFPDPEDFFKRMREMGFRVTLWQYPYVRRDVDLHKTAKSKGYIGKPKGKSSRDQNRDTIDLTNPEAVKWYQGLLADLLKKGASAIKTDFGETINEDAEYKNMPAEKLRNLYALLYQKAAWEVTKKETKEPIVWARAGWAGCQRYPVHWGGDCASTWQGMAGSLCGGLHLGLSGFGFWSHDVPGFHGLPDFMESPPSDELYVRWTQLGVFTSHMRYHGTNDREPWHFPEVAPIVRQWWHLRYALMPYIIDQGQKCAKTGRPMLRSLVFEWHDDPVVWGINDEYLFGDSFLVAPILHEGGVRDVYLPQGNWLDFWTGKFHQGPLWLRGEESSLKRIPIFVRYDSKVMFAEPIQHMDQYDDTFKFAIVFDRRFRGIGTTSLRKYVRL